MQYLTDSQVKKLDPAIHVYYYFVSNSSYGVLRYNDKKFEGLITTEQLKSLQDRGFKDNYPDRIGQPVLSA
jgi:hypothetical protein